MKPPVRSRIGRRRARRAYQDPPRLTTRADDAPVGDAAAGHVARAQREVGAVIAHGGEQAREVRRVVREVGVHLEDVAGAGRERAREARQVGRAEALAHGPVQHLDLARVRRGQLVGDGAGAVGGVVVDDEHPKALGRDLAEHATRGGDDGLEVLGLVEGRAGRARRVRS